MKRRYETLAEFLESTGTTQDALASELDVHPSYVSLLVAGKRQPNLALALRIERVTGVPVKSLVSEERAS